MAINPARRPTGGLRERKKQRTQAELMDAALRLFSERGFERVTIDDIAEEVEVSPRTFFRYFASKEEVVFADADEYLETLRAILRDRPVDEAPLVAVRTAIFGLVNNYESDRDSIFRRVRIAAETPSLQARGLQRQEQWSEAIAGSLYERLGLDPVSDLRPRLIASCAVAALRVAVEAWVAGGGAEALPDLISDALDFVTHGLRDVDFRGGADGTPAVS